MKRRSRDAVDLLARLFDAARVDEDVDEEEDDGRDDDLPRQPPPPGDPRQGARILARLIADEARRGEAAEALSTRAAAEANTGAPRRRRKGPIRAFTASALARARSG